MNEKVVIKIFLPNESLGKFLYGYKRSEFRISEGSKRVKTLVSYYVITSAEKILHDTSLELLGTISESSNLRDGIQLITDKLGCIRSIKLNGSCPPDNHRAMLLHYEKEKFRESFDEKFNPGCVENNFALFIAQALKAEHEKEHGKSLFNKIASRSNDFFTCFTKVASKVLGPIAPIFQNTVTYQHCCSWRKCLNDERGKNGFIMLDVLLGVIFFLLLNHIQHSGRYFMMLAEFIVNRLRGLLEMLDGSPAGLKLNVQLNTFLHSCFIYHVDLWWNFIVIVEPAINYIFFPITLFGLMGFSFQCAMLCDVITLITLHAHCFYIYAAMLYKLELSSIRSLLRIVLGRRLNVLKSEFISLDDFPICITQ